MNTPTSAGTQLGTDLGTALGAALGTLFVHALPWLLLAFVLALTVFLIVRWFWLWYWRVDEQVALLKDVAGSLRRLEQRGAGADADHAAAVRLGLAPLEPLPQRTNVPQQVTARG